MRAWFTKIVFGKVCMFVCMHVCKYVCLSFHTHVSKALEAKSSLYTRNEGYIEPVLNLWAGELWFKVGNTCWFEIRVERVCKDIVKAFPKGPNGLKNNVGGLLGYQVKRILSSERGACSVHMRTKIKASFDSLPKKFA